MKSDEGHGQRRDQATDDQGWFSWMVQRPTSSDRTD
jgi:hypothetical protein